MAFTSEGVVMRAANYPRDPLNTGRTGGTTNEAYLSYFNDQHVNLVEQLIFATAKAVMRLFEALPPLSLSMTTYYSKIFSGIPADTNKSKMLIKTWLGYVAECSRH